MLPPMTLATIRTGRSNDLSLGQQLQVDFHAKNGDQDDGPTAIFPPMRGLLSVLASGYHDDEEPLDLV